MSKGPIFSRDEGTGTTPFGNSSPPPMKRNPRVLVCAIITPIILLGYSQVGADILWLPTARLHYLKINYPSFLNYAYLLAPAIALGVWLIFLRRFPVFSTILSLLLCVTLLGLTGFYLDSRVERIPISRFLSEEEHGSIEDHLHFPVWHQSSLGGNPELSIAFTADQRRQTLAELVHYPGVLPNTESQTRPIAETRLGRNN